MRALFEPAIRIALAIDHPAHDRAYLALANARGCDFVTADETLSRKALAPGVGSRILALRAIGPV
jgi:predicted nucleic acid-binding protein